jgi:hypothetical protein
MHRLRRTMLLLAWLTNRGRVTPQLCSRAPVIVSLDEDAIDQRV